MTSFPATARLVRDESFDPRVRRVRLRNCLYHFAPFGFHATWDHLTTAHRVPERIEADPASPVRALVLPRAAAFAARRRLQKRVGRRVPATLHPWDSWGCHAIAYCPDPRKHPVEPLPVVVGRVLDACAAGVEPAGRCLACGDDARRPQRACRLCGVLPGGRGTPR
ncbi:MULTISPECIES: hypothetical protein [Catenuloplanes]|uniref:Uncharacterized protein n=1 Tax=Catenuloplanes niger TaxID=587534 RepID=A0AAE3ZZ51_9ACTN|nr:hypothetical protein [Catenuloplanes niger]MDR7327909.1 hypothetical protein [Catenuloplanes niger]